MNKKMIPLLMAMTVTFGHQYQALALPGHSIHQEKQWATENKFLLELEKGQDEKGNPIYQSQRKTGKGSIIRFMAYVETKSSETVTKEKISILTSKEELQGVNEREYFNKNHKKMFDPILQMIYGEIILSDYNIAETDVQLEINGITYFYRGKRYGYLLSYNLGTEGCKDKNQCPHTFTIEIYDSKDYQQAVKEGRNQKKTEPVDINLFPK